MLNVKNACTTTMSIQQTLLPYPGACALSNAVIQPMSARQYNGALRLP